MLSCLVVQHVEPECPFAIEDALRAAGLDVDTRRVDVGEPLPANLDEYAALVVMGGPMSAATDEGFPTRPAELALLGEAIERQLPVLGICLGAQLLAVAAGGSVYTGPKPEIGWGTVHLTESAQSDPLFADAPDELTVLHWHGDTYVRPPGSVHLASNAAYAEQAFRCGERAWGLQFHLEVDGPAVNGFVEAFGDEVEAAGTTPEQIRRATDGSLEWLVPHQRAILARFAAVAAAVAAGAERMDLADGRVIEPA